MAIEPECIFCKKELDEPGALILGPPDHNDKVKKEHVCAECYNLGFSFFYEPETKI